MASFVHWIQPYLPLAGIVLALLGVLILVLLILHLRKAAKQAAAPAPPPAAEPQAPPAEPLRARQRQPLSLDEEPIRKADHSLSQQRAMDVLRGRRYKMPWYAMVGASGSGKTALIDSIDIGLERIDGGPSAAGEEGWWLFDGGVVVDVPGSVFLSDTGPGSDLPWRRFLHRLRRARTRRPLNGIILTLSSEDLIGLSALDREGLLERGRDLHTRLRNAQQITGLRLPIYVVVSKCDKISGFTSYWASLPGRRHSEMFGWSNPNSVDAAYRSEWISEAFSGMVVDLFRGQVAATHELAVGDLRGPGMVMFPTAFSALESPLQAVLSMIFQPTAYHEAFFLRGLWFTGALPPPVELARNSEAQRTANPGADVVPTVSSLAHVRPEPILMRQLLRQKIFPERAVARPLSRSWRTDTVSVRRAKVATVAGGLVLCGGLAWSAVELRHDLKSLELALGAVRADMDRDAPRMNGAATASTADTVEGIETVSQRTLAARPLQQEVDGQLKLNAARALLDALASIRTNSLSVLFMPGSWFSPVDDLVADFLSRGFEHVVIDAMEQQLTLRAETLFSEPLMTNHSAQGTPGRPASAEALLSYLKALDALDATVQRFNNLGGAHGTADLPELVRDLMDIDLPPEFNRYPDLLQAAMQRQGARRFPVHRYSGLAAERATQLVWMALNDLTEKGELAETLRLLANSLQHLEKGGQDADGATLTAVRDQIKRVQDLLGEPWWAMVANGELRGEGEISKLLVQVGENAFLGPEVRDRLTADIQGALRRFHSKLTAYTSSLTGPLLTAEPGGTVSVSTPVQSLGQTLTALFKASFMAPTPVEVIPRVTGRVEWDDQRLDHAVSLWRAYDKVLADDLPKFPQALRPRVQAVMDRRLVNILVWNIAHAIKPLPIETSWQGPSESLVIADVANLSEATEPLGLLITAFNETGNVVQRDDLSDAVAGAAYDLLGRIDGLLGKDTLYLPLNSIDAWQGRQPVTAVLFNAPDDVALQQYLTYQRERAHRLTNDYAEPALAAIGMADTGRNSTNRALVQRWQRLYQDVDGYYKRRPGSPLVQLESFIRFGLADMRVGNCIERLSAMEPIQASGDYFLSRRTDILTQVMARCDALNGGSGTLGNAYAQLADRFNSSLAGRYPFAASPDGQGLRAATPTDIRAFFVALDSLRPRIEKDIQGGTMTTIQQMQVQTFLSQIDAVRAFLAPLLDGKPGAPPGAYALDVNFRTNRAFEVNGNQILTWTMQIGAQKLQDPPLVSATPATPSAPQWHWGDPVSIRLQWAKNSPLQPQAVAGGQPSLDPPSTAVFSASDPWALITLMRMQAIQQGQFNPAMQPQPNVLALTIPTQAPGAEGPPAVGQSTQAGAAKANTQVFLRIGLSNAEPPPGGKAAAPQETLILPIFPTSAPVSGQMTGGR